MRKDFGPFPAVFPMPVLIVAAYDKAGVPCAMNAAWGMISDRDQITLFIDEDHKTTQNIRETGAFTVSLADREHMAAADFLGIATGNKMADKFARTGLHAARSARVDAPVVEEYPMTLECEVVEFQRQPYGLRVLGRIVGILADESVLDEKGRIDAAKLNAFAFDPMRSGYYALGGKIGQAWQSGAPLMKK